MPLVEHLSVKDRGELTHAASTKPQDLWLPQYDNFNNLVRQEIEFNHISGDSLCILHVLRANAAVGWTHPDNPADKRDRWGAERVE